MTETTRLRILFVDDEIAVLQGLRLSLRGQRARWDMEFVTGGAEALAALRQRPCNVVVSDLRMPGMDGATLLGVVSAEFPTTVRIVLSGYADPATLERARRVASVLLSKPCEHLTLREAIERAID